MGVVSHLADSTVCEARQKVLRTGHVISEQGGAFVGMIRKYIQQSTSMMVQTARLSAEAPYACTFQVRLDF